MTDEAVNMERVVLLGKLERNRKGREKASRQLDGFRDELRLVVQRGAQIGLPVGEMAEAAGVSREAASRLIHHGKTYVSKDAA